MGWWLSEDRRRQAMQKKNKFRKESYTWDTWVSFVKFFLGFHMGISAQPYIFIFQKVSKGLQEVLYGPDSNDLWKCVRYERVMGLL